MRIISIIKDRHLGTFEQVEGMGIHGHCVRACDYKVFYEDMSGRVGMESAIDDDYIIDERFPSDCFAMKMYSRRRKRKLELVEEDLKNEISL